MKSRRFWLAATTAVILVTLALVVLPRVFGQRDLSNYTVDESVTIRVIELFDRLGMKNGEEFVFGGITGGKAVGPTGLSSAMYLGIRESAAGDVLGVHRLIGLGSDEIRFSFGNQNPFDTMVLSASLSESKELRESFEAMMERLKHTDKSHHRWISGEVEYRKRSAEQVAPSNGG